MSDNIYFSLDEAREELAKRWKNTQLRNKVEAELGGLFWDSYKGKPRAHLARCLASPDNGFVLFWQNAHYINASPIMFEFLGDKFVSINEEKKGLGRLCLNTNDNEKIVAELLDFQANEGEKIGDVVTKTGEKIVDFYHDLFIFSGYQAENLDKTEWFYSHGKSSDYYYHYLCHFIAHGVLFETFVFDEDEREKSFTKKVVLPAIERVVQNYGLKPLIVRLYPENQSESEDFYWWSYPPHINNYLLSYVKTHNLPCKKI